MEKHKFRIYAPIDYVVGHLRYGHLEGDVELTKEELDAIKENPNLLKDYDEIKLVIDDYECEDCGCVTEVDIREYL